MEAPEEKNEKAKKNTKPKAVKKTVPATPTANNKETSKKVANKKVNKGETDEDVDDLVGAKSSPIDVEVSKVVTLINYNAEPNFITKVNVKSINDMIVCISKVAEECPDTVIMLLAVNVTENSIYVAVSYPSNLADILNLWLYNSIQTVLPDGSVAEPIISISTNKISDKITSRVRKISYPLGGEHFAFKYVDQIIGNAFAELRKVNLYKDASDDDVEYELDI